MKPFLTGIIVLFLGISSLRAGTGMPVGGAPPVRVDLHPADTLPNAIDTMPIPGTIPSIDSLLSDEALLADLRGLLDSMGIRKSFFSVDLGVGNRLFSLRNNSFNAQQVAENRVSFTPSLAYYHKSGLGVSATAFMSVFDGKASFYQYAFSPSYDFLNSKQVAFGVSYAYYLTRDDLSFYATPFRHELYGYVRGRKGWLRPGFNAGWPVVHTSRPASWIPSSSVFRGGSPIPAPLILRTWHLVSAHRIISTWTISSAKETG
jgi:hypothetical protein